MWVRFFRRAIVAFMVGAFLSAGIQPAGLPGVTASHDMMVMAQSDGGASRPCEGMTPDCMTDLGCILMVGLPIVSSLSATTRLSWSRIRYGEIALVADGLTRKPALGPPIFLG